MEVLIEEGIIDLRQGSVGNKEGRHLVFISKVRISIKVVINPRAQGAIDD